MRAAHQPTGAAYAPQPNLLGTLLMVIGLLLTGLNLRGELATDVARLAAYGAGASLALSLALEMRQGLRNIVRADVFAMLALYFLTFFEFLFSQPDFDMMVGAAETRPAAAAVLWGLAGIAIGRHLTTLRRQPLQELFTRPVPPSWLFSLFWLCFALGFLHMFVAVGFNPVELVKEFMAPRFTQPWQRGRLGDWRALLAELALFLYLLPPIAGVMIARRRRYSRMQVMLCLLGLLFLLFYGFSSGTRHVFAAYLVTFLIAYAFASPPERRKELLLIGTLCGVLLLVSTVVMLRFREIGLANYFHGRDLPDAPAEQSLFVDLNLYAITQIMETFPSHHRYLGWEVPYLALVRPIPRAVWPGKPEGLSSTIEDALGVENMTIAASFVGEAYMSGGMVAVFVIAVLFGALTGWWGNLASPRNSDLGILIFASGFFAAVISMRSLFVFTTALLPTIGIIVISSYLVRRSRYQLVPAHRSAPTRNSIRR